MSVEVESLLGVTSWCGRCRRVLFAGVPGILKRKVGVRGARRLGSHGALTSCRTGLAVWLFTPTKRPSIVSEILFPPPPTYSTSPWKALEGAIAQLMNTMSFYAFRLGKKLVFVGPYPSYPEEPQPSPLDLSRRSSAPSTIGTGSPVGRGISNESPVDRVKVAAKLLLAKGSRLGWNNNNKPDHHRDGEDRWGGWEERWDGSFGGPHSSTPTGSGSVTTGSVSDSSGGYGYYGGSGGDGSTRSRGKPEKAGSRIDHAVEEALDRWV